MAVMFLSFKTFKGIKESLMFLMYQINFFIFINGLLY